VSARDQSGSVIGVFCNNCGHRNPAGSNFCSSCGAPLPVDSEETTINLQVADVGGEQGGDELELPLHELPVRSAMLVVKRGPNAGSRYVLDAEVVKVGRHPESDIFLDDITVSRRHAEFIRSGSHYLVRDSGSLNGTYVNRERVEEAELSSGDEVQIGKFKLIYIANQMED
jgi:pSer/pThr/pTyr-binding forkhead associated (FHA) protein